MDRKFAYAGQVPLSADFLTVQRQMMTALAYDTQAWAGPSTIVDGLTCIPTAVASLAVQITPGSICSLNALDQSSFGSLPVDVTHQIMQQGILLDAVSLTLTPPTTSGQSVNYLIQVQFQQADTDPIVLAYFNSANPRIPFMGPGNSGTAQPTTRKGIISIQAKSGVSATAGTQVTPAPDVGYTGLYAVTVANGATALTSSQIAVLPTAPFLSVKLPAVPSYVQSGVHSFASADTGTANAMVATLAPIPTGYAKMSIFVKKMGSANTGGMTANINGLGAVSIVNADGTALATGQMAANFLAHLVFDGTSLRFMNGVATSSVGSITASSGEGINVSGAGVVALNFPGLASNLTPGNTDLFGYFNQTDVHHRSLTWLTLINSIFASSPFSLLRITPFTSSGTWTKGTNTKTVLILGLGGGGAGGSNQNNHTSRNIDAFYGAPTVNQIASGVTAVAAGGGGAGGGFLAFQNVQAITTLSVTIGAFGTPISNSTGNQGGTTSVGTVATATGGFGGKVNYQQSTEIYGDDYPRLSASTGPGGAGGTGSLSGGVVGLAWDGTPGASATPMDGGVGASTMFGAGGVGGDDAGAGLYGASGGPGVGYGAGGGGSDQRGAGARGASGVVLFIEFS